MKKLWLLIIPCFCMFFVGCKGQVKCTSYDITCSLTDNVLIGCEKVDYFNDTTTAIEELKFNLFANAYRKGAKYSPISIGYYSRSYYNGESYGNIEIEKVCEDNIESEFSICGEDKNILVVKLNGQVFPNERVSLTIEYKITLANVISRTGINKKTVNLSAFYPILCHHDNDGFYECVYYSTGDPFYSDCANYNISITVNDEFVIASPVSPKRRVKRNGNSTYYYEYENARSFNLVLSKYYQVTSGEIDGINVNYYYYDDENYQDNLNTALKAIKTFNDLFGKYPYKEFNIAKAPFLQGGMEYPGLVIVGDDLESSAFSEVIVHETAHQWWQTAVGDNEIEYGFLDEGLAEYSVVLFYENNSEYGYERQNLIKAHQKTYKTFCSLSDELFNGVDTSMQRSLKDFKSEYEYVNIAYIKSCLMLDELRKGIGDEMFILGLKNFYQRFCFKIATPDDLISTYCDLGINVEGFFNSFIKGKTLL